MDDDLNNDNGRNIERNNEFENNKYGDIVILLITIILLIVNIGSIYEPYVYLINSSYKYPIEIYDKCIKYQTVVDIIFSLFTTLALICLALLSIIIISDMDVVFENFSFAFLYFFYYVFGIFMFVLSVIGLFNFNKIGYDCISENPIKYEFNVGTFVWIIFFIFLSGMLTFAMNIMESADFVSNSIKFSKDGDYFLGKAFWKYVLSDNEERQHEN